MSCCGGNCGCGSGCKCNGCGGCKMYPDFSVSETTTTTQTTIIAGVAPVKMYSEGSEMSFGEENDDKCAGGCKCGSGCSCSHCNC